MGRERQPSCQPGKTDGTQNGYDVQIYVVRTNNLVHDAVCMSIGV